VSDEQQRAPQFHHSLIDHVFAKKELLRQLTHRADNAYTVVVELREWARLLLSSNACITTTTAVQLSGAERDFWRTTHGLADAQIRRLLDKLCEMIWWWTGVYDELPDIPVESDHRRFGTACAFLNVVTQRFSLFAPSQATCGTYTFASAHELAYDFAMEVLALREPGSEGQLIEFAQRMVNDFPRFSPQEDSHIAMLIGRESEAAIAAANVERATMTAPPPRICLNPATRK
jgi:hypothetical protein